jgi:hypothetical protein
MAIYPAESLDGVVVRLARTVEDYRAAFRLVHDSYVDRGLLNPHPTGELVTPYHARPDSTVFLIELHRKVIGTCTLFEDSVLGLPVDSTFQKEMNLVRGPGRHVGELGSAALARGYRHGGYIQCLNVTALRYARARLGVTDFLMVVDDCIADYCDAMYSFRQFTQVRNYCGFASEVRVEEDPVVGVVLRVADAMRWAASLPPPTPGTFGVGSLANAPFPAPYEDFPDPTLTRRGLDRYRLAPDVYHELFEQSRSTADVELSLGRAR